VFEFNSKLAKHQTCSLKETLSGLSDQFGSSPERFCDNSNKTSGDANDETRWRCPSIYESLDGVMRYTTDCTQKADADPAKAVDQALPEPLRSLASGNFVPLTMFVIQGESIEVS
jgi:hypothetical protein